ncbi:growth hormone-regulated TBC protein 1-A-like [Ornithodoros turicata]
MAQSYPYDAKTDVYGFERPDDFDYKSYNEFFANYLSVLYRRGRKWNYLISKDRPIKKGWKVKRYVRKGIPKEHRKQVWMIISGAQTLRDLQPGLYRTLLQTHWQQEIVESIRIDVPRTFPDNIFFRNEHDGNRLALFDILAAHAHHQDSPGYCQGLNFVAGLLLLTTEDAEVTFWLLHVMVTQILPDYYTNDMLGLLTDIEVLAELISMKAPPVYEHLRKHGVSWALLTTKWFVCLFAEVLPIETVLRIWDSLFYEGSKILFRVAITLIIINQDRILAAPGFTEITTVFKDITGGYEVINCHSFMQAIFKKPGSISSSLIQQLRAKCRERVCQEQARLRQR